MALGKPQSITRMGVAEGKTLEPGGSFTQIGNSRIHEARPDFSIPAHCFRHRFIIWQRFELQCFVAILHPPRRISSMNEYCTGAPQADYSKTDIVTGGGVFENAAAVT